MPRRCSIDHRFEHLVAAQDHVVSRDQALEHGMSRHALENARRYDGWRLLLPGVYLTHRGEPLRRQLLVAALLYCGPDSAIDDVDACRFHGVPVAVDEDRVFVVVPAGVAVRSRGFVVVRRTVSRFDVVQTDRVRYVNAATAVVAAARRRRTDRAVLGLVSEAVQRRIVTVPELQAAHLQATPRNSRRTAEALDALSTGIRSAPEGDFRVLAEASPVLPPLLYNSLLRLPDGRVISPDALCVDAALVHETNGRSAHAREDLFEDMQERHGAMTSAGLTVLHSTPRQLRSRGRQVIERFERCYLRDRGRGLPEGVQLIRRDEMSS